MPIKDYQFGNHQVHTIIPAKAGTQEKFVTLQAFSWVPDPRFALSGMTLERVDFSK
jgi:hypothetical protein